MRLLVSCTIAIVALFSQASHAHPFPGSCLPVPHFCRNLTSKGSYTQMLLPNVFEHRRLNETVDGIRPWEILVGKCHHGLKLFLCSIYAPICLQDPGTGKFVEIKPCRSFCLTIRASCEPVMFKHRGIQWPDYHEAFNCSGYAANEAMCVHENFLGAPPTPASSGTDICDKDDAVLQQKVCSSDLAIRAEVSKIVEAKTQGFQTLLKLKRHQKKTGGKTSSRSTRKAKKTRPDFPDRVLVPENSGCLNLRELVMTDNQYLIVLEQSPSFKKKTKYIVKAIVPWNKKYKNYTKPNYCRQK